MRGSEPSGLSDEDEPRHEDLFVFPDEWLRHLHPRRGGTPGPKIRLDKKALAAADALVASARDEWLDEALEQHAADHAVVGEIRRALEGEASPLGAAALATATVTSHTSKLTPFVDAWTLRRGIAFAAAATVKLGSVWVERSRTQIQINGRTFQPAAPAQFKVECYGHSMAMKSAPLRRMRALLASCSDADYAAAITALEQVRACCDHCRAAAAYLVPTQIEWVADACREFGGSQYHSGDLERRRLLQCSLSTDEQVVLLGEQARLRQYGSDLGACVTMIDGLGEAAAPLFADSLGGDTYARDVREIASAVARIPGDAALRMLIDRLDQPFLAAAVQEAITRFPRRALALLTDAADDPDPKKAAPARELLQRHVRTHRDYVVSAVAELPEQSAATIRELLSQNTMKPAAPAESLPALLASPPWAHPAEPKPPAEPIVADGLVPPALADVTWTDEELARVGTFMYFENLRRHVRWDFEEVAAQVANWAQTGEAGWSDYYVTTNLFGLGPVDPNRELIRSWRPEFGPGTGPEELAWPVLRRFGPDAIPAVVHAARTGGPGASGAMLLPVLDLEAARLAADWLARLKTGREPGAAWLQRHGADAAVLLIPDAVGKPGKARAAAEAALRHLAGTAADPVGTAERAYGADAAAAVRAILAQDFVERVAAPSLPDWLDPAALPQILLRGGDSALPASATRHLVEALVLAGNQSPISNLAETLDILDRRSLAEFCWQVFEAWRSVGHPAKQAWALALLGRVGDDETATRLAPLIKAWPGESKHHHAVTGLDVLAGIGTDHAVRLLNEIAQRSQFKALKDTAVRKISQIAERRGMTGEQLADRLVPDLGLDADGGLWLDYGPRRFRVGFDEQLKPFVSDESGKLLKSLPAPGAKDDAELATAARARFTALKKQARAVASIAIRRLEAALVEQRSWTAAEFTELLLGHPLLRHVVRRLVWVSEADGVRESFRVAEDLSLADVEDNGFTLAPEAEVRLVHPLTTSRQGLSAWGEIFADYEILQPFPQLGRAVYELTDEEKATYRLTRFEGRRVPIGRILGLTGAGWRRSPAMDNGIENCITRRIDADRHLVIDLDDGIPVGLAAEDRTAEQTLDAVYLSPHAEVYHQGFKDSGLRFADLDPITASELLGQLSRLVD